MCRKSTYLISFALVLALTLTLTSTANAELVGWWKLDEESGSIAQDSSGNGNDGTCEGDVRWVAGMIGGAWEGDGAGDYIRVPHSESLNISDAVTVAMWLYGGMPPDQPISKGSGGTAWWDSYAIRLDDSPSRAFDFRGRTGMATGLNSSATHPTNEWTHIAATFDASAPGNNQKIYINGQLDAEIRIDQPLGTTTDDLLIGADAYGGTRWHWQGMLDDVRIYNEALPENEIQGVMLGAPPGDASNPNPADEATDVPTEVLLSWTPGESAEQHDVYFGTNFDDVNAATKLDPMGPDKVYRAHQGVNSYAVPETLALGQTYYWRVDAVEADGTTIHTGDVWSFTVELFAYPISGENITATASSSDESKGPENTVNGSGLDDSGLLHGNLGEGNMWLSSLTGDQPTWIQYEFDKVYKLHQMWVWNSNESLESVVGLGFKDVSIEYSLNGTDYMTLGTTAEFAKAPGVPDYAHDTTVDLSGVAAKYVRLTANSNWGGILNQYGLSEVRFFHIPVHAREPNPDSGATGVDVDVTLGFRAGREAAKHDVYFSTDEQAVVDGTADVTTVTETSYGPLSLYLGKTYYWRVDEVNEAETPATWQGDLWDFTTQEYFTVDDFESYNDLDTIDPNSNRIFNTWIDGYEQPTNGSIVGYAEAPFAEQNIVHGGKQSIPLAYDNSGAANYSEATLTLSSGRDWTVRGIEALSLWFRGNRVALVEEPPGTFTVNASGVDIWATSDEFRYVWKQLSGDCEIVAQVLSVENTHEWAKAGVMIRDTLDAGSPNVFVAITGGGGDGATFQWRTAPGGTSSSSRTLVGISPPASVKLVRRGSIFTGYVFLDGQWQQEGRLTSVTMTDPVYIGLAVTSHAANVTCEAVFSDVQTTGAVSGQFTEQAIGIDMPANGPASMYVALANNGGTPAVVYHDDPSATQISDWMEWLIDLKQFSDGGVNLTNINTISIGFGDKNNPQPGSLGIMYFDDIRLYPSAIEP